jgi:hypothetical protein
VKIRESVIVDASLRRQLERAAMVDAGFDQVVVE